MLSLKLFNAVLTSSTAPNGDRRIIDTLPFGYVIAPEAAHLTTTIIDYYEREMLDGNQLNQTFHKSWAKVQEATREELLAHQLMHYFSTYGLRSLGIEDGTVYLPAELCEVPELRKAPIRIIRGLSADELAEKAMDLLRSGVALAEETLNELIELLVEIDRVPETAAGIRNREALVRLADRFAVYPTQPAEFLRYLIYKATDNSLLIKNDPTIAAIKEGVFDISSLVSHYGPERCAEVFLRFKPLWLAFKVMPANIPVINRLAKLAKKHHRPLPADYLNGVTALDVINTDELRTALASANNFRKIRLLYALNTRRNGADYLLYRIRNGKAFVTESTTRGKEGELRRKVWDKAYSIVLNSLIAGLEVSGKTFLLSPNVHYALPATEKMFIGNLPVGSRVESPDPMAVGIYWRNDWGARDLDLSSVALTKVGWNAAYNADGITYSGDITDAPDGATELLRFGADVTATQLVYVNVFSGQPDTAYKVFAGLTPRIRANYMLKPDELLMEVKTTTNTRQQVIGFLVPRKFGQQTFILVNTGMGRGAVAGAGEIAQQARAALYAQWATAPMLADVLAAAGAQVTTEPDESYDFDLRYEQLEKDSILRLFA